MSKRDKWTTEFVSLVEQLRAEQKKFFSTRQQVHLVKSKELEKQVDANVRDFKLNGLPPSAPVIQEKLEL